MKKRVMSVLCVICAVMMLSGCNNKEEIKAPSDVGVSQAESQSSDVSEESSNAEGESTSVSSVEESESSGMVQTESSNTTVNSEGNPAEVVPMELGSTDIFFADGSVFKSSWTGKDAEAEGWVCDTGDYLVDPKNLSISRPTYSKGELSVLITVFNNDTMPKSFKECQICAIDVDVLGASLCNGATVIGTTTSDEVDTIVSPIEPEQQFQNSCKIYLPDDNTVYSVVYSKDTNVVSGVGVTVRTKSGVLFA